MSEFMTLEAKAPATLGAVVEAVTHLSTLSEAQVLEAVSAGKIQELFPFTPAEEREIPADTIADADLIEASAMPLSQAQRARVLESSMPSAARPRSAAKRAPKRRGLQKTR